MEYNYFTILWLFSAIHQQWISHWYTCVPPSWTSLATFLPTLSLWVVPEHQLWVPCFMHRTHTGHLFYIWSYTCFNAILSNHPTLTFSQSSKVWFSNLCLFCCPACRLFVNVFLSLLILRSIFEIRWGRWGSSELKLTRMSQGQQRALVTVHLNGALMVLGLGLVLTVCVCSTDWVTCTISGRNPSLKANGMTKIPLCIFRSS